MKKARQLINKIKGKIGFLVNKILKIIDRYPMASFFGLIGLIILLILAGNFLRKPSGNNGEVKPKVKTVSVYSIGSAPKIRLQAKIEKSGVIRLIALAPGVVQQIYFDEGQQVTKGANLFWLSSNYQGGSAATLTRQIAYKNYAFIKDTHDAQKEIIAKNKEMAEKGEAQASELRDIGAKSIEETNSLISLNEDVIRMIDSQITALEQLNVNGSSDSAILQLKTGKLSAQAGLNQAKAALRSTEYQTSDEQEPADLARLQKDVTIKQLEIQEKSLDLNKEIALLNLRLVQIQESLMYPASPVNGIVERIYVKVGQSVAPGTLMATITGDSNSATAIAATSQTIADKISRIEPSKLLLNNQVLELYPSYISMEPTEGSLHSVQFTVNDGWGNSLSDGQIVQVEVPIGLAQTSSAIPYIPLDAIYQTRDEAYVYLAVKNRKGDYQATSQKITLNEIYGQFVEVASGLAGGDQVINERNVIEGDLIKIQH